MPRSATRVAKPLDRDTLIARLREVLPELRERHHVRSLGLFGSYARGEADARSDVDLLVEFDVTPTLFSYGSAELFIQDSIGVKVDLVMRDALKPAIGRRVLREMIPI